MAPDDSRPRWEQRLIETTEPWNGWSITRVRDRIVLRVRESGRPAETAYLPRPNTWDEMHHRNAIRWIEAVYRAWDNGKKSMKAAIADAHGRSDLQGEAKAKTWGEIADAMQLSRVEQSQKCSAETFQKNWRPFIDHAVELINTGKVHDGTSLLKMALKKWDGSPTMKVECGRYLGLFMQFAVSRHKAPGSWLISKFDKDELIAKPPKPRLKAVLDDNELLNLIELADSVNHRWGNVFRLLTQFGLRPIELQHLSSRTNPVSGQPAIWCNYRKTGGEEETEPRFLEAMYVRDADDQPVVWPLEQAMADGTLLLPTGNDGNTRKLSGAAVNCYLHRKSRSNGKPSGAVQRYWADLVEKYGNKDPKEWMRPYSFRDTYSIRCHREKVPVASICDAMGHSEAVHNRSYRTMTLEMRTSHFAAETSTMPLPTDATSSGKIAKSV